MRLKKLISLQMSYIQKKLNTTNTEEFLSDILPVEVQEFFANSSCSAYVVGGAVRDWLLGKRPVDFDIAIDGDISKVATDFALFARGKIIELDSDREIIRINYNGQKTFTTIDLNPFLGDIKPNLLSRDFTINSLAIKIPSGSDKEGITSGIIDVGAGINDIMNSVVRMISVENILDDPIRILRAVRISRELGFSIEIDTKKCLRDNSALLCAVAPERIRDEFLRILDCDHTTGSLLALDRIGILTSIFPELELTKNVLQPKEHYWDVFNHLVHSVGYAEKILARVSSRSDDSPSPFLSCIPYFEGFKSHFFTQFSDGYNRSVMLKLACLLHDIAKPQTKTVESNGKMRFLKHQIVGVEVASQILERLKISKKGARLVTMLVRHHLRPSQMAPVNQLPTDKAIYRYYRDLDDVSLDNLYLNMADYLAARGPDLELDNWEQHCRIVSHIIDRGLGTVSLAKLPKLVDGHDIMSEFSIQPGRKLGKILQEIKEAQALGIVTTRAGALEFVSKNLTSGVESA